jgi:imidazolonepropionase-like amidohydrolase
MKNFLSKFLIGLLLFVGLVLLYLTNSGVLSFDKPYIYAYSSVMPGSDPVVVFTNVNVIPMDSERVSGSKTVVVRDGVIEMIGDSGQVHVPADALVIDGRGKYLMPGLVDMHVHIMYENDMLLLIANGVTSVRNMWGNTGKALQFGLPDQLVLRKQIDQGTLFGPTIYTAGPVMEGSPVFHPLADAIDSPEIAGDSVAWQKAQGYDFIKVYDHLSPDVYQAILTAARQNDMLVVGHVPLAVGLDNVLAGGQQTIEHMSGYIDPDTVEFIISQDQLVEYALKTSEAGVWNCVTMSEYPKSKETPAGFERLQNQPGMIYISPGTRMLSPFLYLMASKAHTYQNPDYPERIADLNRRMVIALHQAGAGLLLGTDAAQAYHLPGYSIHEELAFLTDAGLSPYEAIEAGTRNAAEAMGKSGEFGTIETGKRADLILLEDNPLNDVGSIQKRVGVMVRGRWMAEEQLQSMLEGLANSYKPNLVERIWPLSLIVAAGYLIIRKARRASGES